MVASILKCSWLAFCQKCFAQSKRRCPNRSLFTFFTFPFLLVSFLPFGLCLFQGFSSFAHLLFVARPFLLFQIFPTQPKSCQYHRPKCLQLEFCITFKALYPSVFVFIECLQLFRNLSLTEEGKANNCIRAQVGLLSWDWKDQLHHLLQVFIFLNHPPLVFWVFAFVLTLLTLLLAALSIWYTFFLWEYGKSSVFARSWCGFFPLQLQG